MLTPVFRPRAGGKGRAWGASRPWVQVRVAPGQRRAQVPMRTSLARCSKDVFLCALRKPPMFHGGACSGRKCSEEAEGSEGKVHEQQSKSQTQSLEEEVSVPPQWWPNAHAPAPPSQRTLGGAVRIRGIFSKRARPHQSL